MRASKPATGPPLSLQEFGSHSLDVLAPRFCFLRPEHPADPFIAGKRCEVFPCCENLWVVKQDASQILRDCMCHSAGDRPGAHRSPIVAPMRSTVALRSAPRRALAASYGGRRQGWRRLVVNAIDNADATPRHALDTGLA